MAPMDPAKAEDGLCREVLETALSGHSSEELQEMGRRLAKSVADLQEMLRDLEAEQQDLQEENVHLNQTISLMMKEMHKLNIGADNTVEPMLEEGPLDFVGRFWEKVKPRDTAVVVSEHVGEIKKPVPLGDGAPPLQSPQELGRQVQEKGKQVVQKLSGALGPIWQRAGGLLQQAQGEIGTAVANRMRAQQPARGPREARERDPRMSEPQPQAVSTEVQEEVEAESPTASTAAPAAPVPTLATAPAAPAPAPASAGDAPAGAAAVAVPAPVANGGAEERLEGADDQISSTILIEAQLKIDDGSVQTLYVRAADRCKEVAHRFVQEHSLKAWFEEPLTTWLKKVEADAVKFPVMVEGDLMEIRKQYAKK